MTRQTIITRHQPIRFETLIDEGVLQRTAATSSGGREQLEHLANLAAKGDVAIRVLPLGVGPHASHVGGFEILELEPPYPEAALVPSAAGEICVEGSRIEVLNEKYDRLLGLSLDPAESLEVITSERDKL